MRTRTKIVLALLLAAVVSAAAFYFPVGHWILRFVEWMRGLGPGGAALYGLVYAVGTVLMLPGTALTAGAGFVYGPLLGTLVASPASVLGATAAFLLARSFARGWVEKRIHRYPRFAAIDRAVAKRGFLLVLLMRLDPVFIPFAMLNYALGLTKVRLRDYVLASFLGMLPATVLYVYLGSALNNAAALLSGHLPGADRWERILFWVGLPTAALLVVVLTRIAKQALDKQLEEAAPAPEAKETTA